MYHLSGTAYRYALKAEGASVRQAAAWMGVSPTVVQRLVKHGERVTALRSRRLRRHYLACLARLVKADDRKRSPGYVAKARRHGGNVARATAKRQRHARAGKKRDGAKGTR